MTAASVPNYGEIDDDDLFDGIEDSWGFFDGPDDDPEDDLDIIIKIDFGDDDDWEEDVYQDPYYQGLYWERDYWAYVYGERQEREEVSTLSLAFRRERRERARRAQRQADNRRRNERNGGRKSRGIQRQKLNAISDQSGLLAWRIHTLLLEVQEELECREDMRWLLENQRALQQQSEADDFRRKVSA